MNKFGMKKVTSEAPSHYTPALKPTQMQAINFHMTCFNMPGYANQDMLTWINLELKSEFSQIQQLGSGAAYCQLMDKLFPGSINLKKVKFETQHECARLINWKLLQLAFDAVGLVKEIPIEQLMSFRYQANHDFAKWFCKVFELNKDQFSQRPYNALKARDGQWLGAANPLRQEHKPFRTKSVPLVAKPIARKAVKFAVEVDRVPPENHRQQPAQEDKKSPKRTRSCVSGSRRNIQRDWIMHWMETTFFNNKMYKIKKLCKANKEDGTCCKVLKKLGCFEGNRGKVKKMKFLN